MTKVTLLQTEDPITLVTPPNISEFLKAQLNDGKPGAALVKDVEAQIEQAAMAPILIRKGALGNTRDLRVSPQHRMLLSGWHAEVLFGEREVLATAKSLVNDHSILREEGGEVEYFHMLFDSHEIVYAEGAPSESFHPGPEGWKALDEPTRNEILELFPQLANGNFDSYGPSARASLNYKEGSLLSHSMISQTQH